MVVGCKLELLESELHMVYVLRCRCSTYCLCENIGVYVLYLLWGACISHCIIEFAFSMAKSCLLSVYTCFNGSNLPIQPASSTRKDKGKQHNSLRRCFRFHCCWLFLSSLTCYNRIKMQQISLRPTNSNSFILRP
ncbi:hypothetical protein ACP275_08G101300 [Erythranthe tilingii]